MEEGYELSPEDIDAILSARPESKQERESELELLKPVIDEGKKLIEDNPVDSKGRYLLSLMMKKVKGEQRKCLIYTGFIETVDYLRELLKKEGYNPLEITGRVSMDDRNRIVKKFFEEETNKVIIGTDAMGESLNLQIASVEINYEVPWSPVSYIQRVGRIWRYGQKNHELFIHNFLPAFKVERRVMEVILEKIRTINREFGDVGLSVFGEELGSIDNLVKKAYSGENIDDHIEDAFKKSVEIGKDVMDVLRKSMELPKVVNVEELKRNNIIDLDDAFSENDLRRFLDYLKDSGIASGVFPDDDKGKNTYLIKFLDEYVRVERLSLQDPGISKAIMLGLDLSKRFGFKFNHKKKMKGRLAMFETKVDDKTVYEEPILVTPEGVLKYRGIMSLTPSFTGKVSSVNFTPLNDYKSKTGKYWLGLSMTKWDNELRVKQNVLFEEKDDYKKEWLRSDLKAWMLKKPKNVIVDEKKEICTVSFLGALNEEAWRGRYEVEMVGMKVATHYYESKKYTVQDVSSQNRGYDIECRRADAILRVEVKGLKTMVNPLMTWNEYRMAEFYKESFVLFIVKIEEDGYSLYEISNPVLNLDITEFMKPVYKVTGYDAFEVS
ncbi:ATP-dependent RNA helicase DbpA [subsurface metagenome]